MEKYTGDKPIIQVTRNNLGTDHLELKKDDSIWIDTPKGLMNIHLNFKDELDITIWPRQLPGEKCKLTKKTINKNGVISLLMERKTI
jgi:hypothetical protein